MLFFLRFFFASLLFIFSSTLSPHHKRHALYTTALNNERMITLLFIILSISALPD
jgi:hypothetical protein